MLKAVLPLPAALNQTSISGEIKTMSNRKEQSAAVRGRALVSSLRATKI